MTDQQHDAHDFIEASALLDEGLPEGERRRLRASIEADPSAKTAVEEAMSYARLVDHFSIGGRQYCPEPEAIARGARGDLDLRQGRFDEHLGACPLCADAVADMRALDAPRFSELVFKLGREAFELVTNSFGEVFEPAPVPVFRGESGSGSLAVARVFDDEARLAITLRDTSLAEQATDVGAESAGAAKAVVRIELERPSGPGAFSALLFQDGQVIDGRSTKDGSITIEDLNRGSYELVVKETATPDGREKVSETLDLDLR